MSDSDAPISNQAESVDPAELPARIMSFGCLAPDVGAALFSEQLLLAHRYRNKLIEIERARRNKFREIRSKWAPELFGLEERLAVLNASIDEAIVLTKTSKHRERELLELSKQIDALSAAEDVAGLSKAMAKNSRLLEEQLRAHEAAEKLVALKAERKELGAQAKEERRKFNGLIDPARVEFKRRVRAHGTTAPRLVEKINAAELKTMLEESEWPQVWKETAENDVIFSEMVKRARETCGVSPGTYLLVEQAMAASKRDVIGDMRFVRNSGEGRIGVQLKDTTAEDLGKGTSRFLQIYPAPEQPGKRYRPEIYQRVRIRVQSAEDGGPIWAELPVMIHRPLPPDALVKWAWILVRRQGPRLIYQLQITLRTSKSLVPARVGDTGAVAVNLGWRRTDRGLRVGYAVGTDDRELSIETDPKSLELFEYCDQLRSFSDRHFDDACRTLREWRKHGFAEPDWLKDAVEFMPHWKAHGKLARIARRWITEIMAPEMLANLWRQWRDERIGTREIRRKLRHDPKFSRLPPPDLFCSYPELSQWLGGRVDVAPESLESLRMAVWLDWWRRKDEHLWAWQANERQHACRRRRQAYRLIAIDLAKRYAQLVYDDTDLRQLADKSQSASEFSVPRHQRQIASPSEFRTQLLEVFGEQRLVRVSSKRNTIECAACRRTMRADPECLLITCSACGTVIDRDRNNCLNQLIRGGLIDPPKHDEDDAAQ